MRIETHRPVLLEECITGLDIKGTGVYLDGTFGRGGHSREIVQKLTTGRLICVDRDEEALAAGEETFSPWKEKVTFVHSNFSDIDRIFSQCQIEKVDGMLFDLGVSSPQLDCPERGFSYMAEARLDMRMDQRESLTAEDIVNLWEREELQRIFSSYGEERYAGRIATAICQRREEQPIVTTTELVEIIKKALPAKALREKQHPAKRCFQGIRIAVNQELSSVEQMLDLAIPRLNPEGKLAVITFHSLEDRIVKRRFVSGAKGCDCPPDFPVCVCGKTPELKLAPKKAILPTAKEIEENPRARSAKLRIILKQ
ncbi:MAG: 16S rRNA (cytosine(1402)-N(4))-methyltransferase RsmH [Eubacteriales bacterium]